jgi:hypothetical protein
MLKKMVKCSMQKRKKGALIFIIIGYCIFIIHQRKGGIHDIYSIFMEAFG